MADDREKTTTAAIRPFCPDRAADMKASGIETELFDCCPLTVP